MGNEHFTQITDAIARQHKAFDEFTERQDERFSTVEQRLDDIEARSKRPGGSASHDSVEIKSFEAFMRSGDTSGLKAPER